MNEIKNINLFEVQILLYKKFCSPCVNQNLKSNQNLGGYAFLIRYQN